MRLVVRILSVFGAAALGVAGLLVAPEVAQAAETRVVCNHDWVRVRSAATTKSQELGRLSRGTQVSGVQQGGWFRLDDGRFVAAYYTCAARTAPPAPAQTAASQPGGGGWAVCRTPWVRVRAAATTSSKELRRLNQGDSMSGSLQGRWLRLDGGAGYVASYYACPAPATPAAPAKRAMAAPDNGTALLQPTGTQGSPTSAFGNRYHPILRTWRLHNGIDIGNRAGAPILAAEAGVVSTVSQDATSGLYVKIDHGTVAGTPLVGSGYLHMASAVVSPGEGVSRGQVIGYVGNTGLSTKPHLHFIVYESGTPVNPEKYLGPLSSLAT